MEKFFSWYYLILVIPFVFMGCKSKPEIIEQKCSICHKTSVVYQKKRPMVEWERLIYGMKTRGLKVTLDEEKSIMEALNKDYSK
ncbi:MAG: hypothetical protein ABSB79_11700 [Syntrophales bacterium]